LAQTRNLGLEPKKVEEKRTSLISAIRGPLRQGARENSAHQGKKGNQKTLQQKKVLGRKRQ